MFGIIYKVVLTSWDEMLTNIRKVVKADSSECILSSEIRNLGGDVKRFKTK